MRCPECNKFVPSVLQEDVDTPDVEVSDTTVEFSVALTLVCEECETELKTGDVEFSVDVAAIVEKHDKDCDGDLEATINDLETFSIKAGKWWHGAQGTVTVGCTKCELHGDVNFKDDMMASSMEECY